MVSFPSTTSKSSGSVIKIVQPNSNYTGTGILKGIISCDYSDTVVSSALITDWEGSITDGNEALKVPGPWSIKPLNETCRPTASKRIELQLVSVKSTGDIDNGFLTLLITNAKVLPASLYASGNISFITSVSTLGVTIKSQVI